MDSEHDVLAPFGEHLRRAQKMELVSNLAAGVSHHFNNLLMGILTASRLAARSLGEGHPALPYLAEIAAASDRGADLTRRLAALGRVDEVHPRALRVGEVLESARDALQVMLGENVRLELAVEAPRAVVLADPDELQQVLVNLSLNAAEAMSDGGVLQLGARCVQDPPGARPPQFPRKLGEHVEISVRDSGRGMDAQTRARVFEPFFTTKNGGTGLGLYIVHGIVQRLRGRVEVDSELGRGTTMRVLLPVHAPVEPAAPSNPRKTRILVVEDERLIRVTLRHTLTLHDFDVLIAADATEARAHFARSGDIDLMLTDMILPGPSGSELAREVLAEHPDLRVLFMSAYSRELLLQQGRITPSQPTLQKPFTDETLVGALHDLLGHRAP
ncbi:MAG: response regulator [Planctomycetes bacterium]|nr:response regulator [Planctomycetota bacterium]